MRRIDNIRISAKEILGCIGFKQRKHLVGEERLKYSDCRKQHTLRLLRLSNRISWYNLYNIRREIDTFLRITLGKWPPWFTVALYNTFIIVFLCVCSSSGGRIFLNFWRRNYFFLILAHPVYKMWIIREPNTLELWNKQHFEEKKNGEILTTRCHLVTKLTFWRRFFFNFSTPCM